MDAESHRIWRYTGLAWVALIAVPTAHAVLRWQLGPGRDVDMRGVDELILTFVLILGAPMAALAFGVFAPLAIGFDHLANGRTPRFVNLVLGAALSAPALVVTAVVIGGPNHGFMEMLVAIRHPERAIGLFAALPLAGILVGLGLRHRTTLPTVRRPSGS